MARHINRLHHSVQGTLPESIGRYPAGEPYSGMEPLALLWVHIVFVDSMLTAYKTFVGPLSGAACEQYWQESCRYARLLGLTDATLPASYAAVQQYLREVLPSGEIAIGPAAHFIAQKVLYPPMPWLRKPLWMIVRLITIGQLPSDIRQAYGLRWTPHVRQRSARARRAVVEPPPGRAAAFGGRHRRSLTPDLARVASR